MTARHKRCCITVNRDGRRSFREQQGGVILDYRGLILDDTFNLFLRTTTKNHHKNQPPYSPQGGRPAGGLADGFNSRAEIEIKLLKLGCPVLTRAWVALSVALVGSRVASAPR
jgi:hypothetical protein